MSVLAAHLLRLPVRPTWRAHRKAAAMATTGPALRRASAADAAAVSRFLQQLSPESRRLRFHGHCNPMSQALAASLCAVDGVRHQAWLAWAGSGDEAVVVGEARLVASTDGSAELAIVVADSWQGRGLANTLMRQVLAAAAGAGVRHLYGEVLDDNTRMQAFMRRHGFDIDLYARGDVQRMRRTLGTPPARVGGAIAQALGAALTALTLRL